MNISYEVRIKLVRSSLESNTHHAAYQYPMC